MTIPLLARMFMVVRRKIAHVLLVSPRLHSLTIPLTSLLLAPASDRLAKDRVPFVIFVENDENTSILTVVTNGQRCAETDIVPLPGPMK